MKGQTMKRGKKRIDTRGPLQKLIDREAVANDQSILSVIDAKAQSRFWDKVDVRGSDECWDWKAYRCEKGYGIFLFAKRPRKATRISLAIAGRPVPKGMQACHHCDNPSCVNPDHLFIGTNRDNQLDSIAKGRQDPARLHRGVHYLVGRTHCKNGHPFDDGNTGVRSDGGGRICKACCRVRALARYHRTKILKNGEQAGLSSND